MKKHNPSVPILIREASGTEPTVYARFGAYRADTNKQFKWLIDINVDFGKEKKLPLKGLDDKSIEQQVTELVQSKI